MAHRWHPVRMPTATANGFLACFFNFVVGDVDVVHQLGDLPCQGVEVEASGPETSPATALYGYALPVGWKD